MAGKRSPQDEKLINDLYEKLNWFTFQAAGEEFDADQVKAILRLLDTLDPLPETEGDRISAGGNKYTLPSDPDAAFERFKQKYHITEEELAKKDAENPDASDADGKIYPFPAEFAEELVPDKNRDRAAASETAGEAGKECGRRASSGDAEDRPGRRRRAGKNRDRRFFAGAIGKVAAGLLIVVGATTFLSIGTSAVQQKSFFEIVRDGVNSMKITVTGNVMETENPSEPPLSLESEEKVYFESWDEVKEENPDILVPGYIPEGLELKELYKQVYDDYTLFKCLYTCKNKDEDLRIWIQYYENNYVKVSLMNMHEWELLKSSEDKVSESYYKLGNLHAAIFEAGKGLYTIVWSDLEQIKDIVGNLSQ